MTACPRAGSTLFESYTEGGGAGQSGFAAIISPRPTFPLDPFTLELAPPDAARWCLPPQSLVLARIEDIEVENLNLGVVVEAGD
jgi:hypothetical protein